MDGTIRRIALLILLILLEGVAAVELQRNYLTENYIILDGQRYSRWVTELDLQDRGTAELEKLAELTELERLDLRNTGLTPEEYVMLSRALPDCDILWSVPYRDGYLDMDTKHLTVDALSHEDLEDFSWLTKLETVDATACRDLKLVFELKNRFPDLEVHYQVSVGEALYPENTGTLTVENADPDQLEAALRVLPELTEVSLTGIVPDRELVYDWMCRYPQIRFLWSFEVCGVTATSTDTELILNGIYMKNVEEVESSLKYFYDLQWVEMCNCGIPSAEMDALWKRHPETRFVWTVNVGLCELRTDTTTFMPYKFGYDGWRALFDRHMGEIKYCVDIICMDLGHMWISDYSFLADMPHMQYLILADTQGTDFSVLAQLKELKYLEIFMTQFDQAEVLVGLTNLEDLNIGNSRLDNIEPLLEMTWLKRLWLPGNVLLDREERKRIVAALPDTQVVYSCEGSTGSGWREGQNYYDMRDLLNMEYAISK